MSIARFRASARNCLLALCLVASSAALSQPTPAPPDAPRPRQRKNTVCSICQGGRCVRSSASNTACQRSTSGCSDGGYCQGAALTTPPAPDWDAVPLRELSALLAPDAKPDQHAFIRDLNKHDWIKPCQKLFVPPTRKEAVPKATVMPPDDGSACEDGSEAAPEAADVADRASVEVTLELRLTGQRGRVVVSDARVLKTVFEFSDDAGKDDLSLSLEPGPYSACLADRLKGTQAPFAGAHVGDRMRVTYPMLLVNLRYPRPAKE